MGHEELVLECGEVGNEEWGIRNRRWGVGRRGNGDGRRGKGNGEVLATSHIMLL